VLFAGLLDWIFWNVIPNLASVVGALLLILSLAAVSMDNTGSTNTTAEVSRCESRLGVYEWLRQKMGRKTIHGTDLESISLESLLSSHDGANLDED
jgi:hypothetical protein